MKKSRRNILLAVVLAIAAVGISSTLFLATLGANPIHAWCHEREDAVESISITITYKPDEPEYQKILNLAGGWSWDYYVHTGKLPDTKAVISYVIYDTQGKVAASGQITDTSVGYCFYGWPPGSKGYTGSLPSLYLYAGGTVRIPWNVGWGATCKFTVKISGFVSFSGGGSTRIWLHVMESSDSTSSSEWEEPTEELRPTAPPKPIIQVVSLLRTILDMIWNWLKNFLNLQMVQIGEKLAVVSGDIAHPGDVFQYQFTLKNTKETIIPDSNYQDGTASFIYAVWFVVDESGSIIHSTDPMEVTISLPPGETYSIAASWQIPNDARGKYVVTAVLFEIPMEWDSSQQKWIQKGTAIIDKQAVEINVNPIPEPPKPKLDLISWLSDLWNQLLEWLHGIFWWL